MRVYPGQKPEKHQVVRKKGTIPGQESPRSNKQNMENDIHILTEDAVDLLKGMIAIPSPSFSEDEVCTYICGWMSNKGLIYRRIGNNIMARLSEQTGADTEAFKGKPTLMLCAHIDTVSPSNEYSFDPYNPDYAKASYKKLQLYSEHNIIPSRNLIMTFETPDNSLDYETINHTIQFYFQ